MLNKLISSSTLHELNLSWPALTSGELALLLLAVSFGLFSALESYVPRVKLPKGQLRQSYKTNFSLFIFNSVVLSLISVTSLMVVAKQHFFGPGLLSYISDPVTKAVLSFLAIDFLLYIWHKASHSFDSLWMFHKVHHNDPFLNVTTGFRTHTVEVLLTNILKALLIIGLGIDAPIVLANEVITTLFVMLHHSNISFKGEKWLGLVFIAPNLHRTHHSVERSEHDSNYGALLSIWDRLFGSLKEIEPAKIGIKGDSPLDFVNLLKFGFTPAVVPVPQPAADVTVDLDAMIAEAAYYKAEKRNFYPGYELNDWLEAKNEIIRMVYDQCEAPQVPARKSTAGYLDWINCAMNTMTFGMMNKKPASFNLETAGCR